jgi:hypothetical protein
MNNIFKYMVTGLLAILPASLVAQSTDLLDALYENFASHCISLDCEYSVVSQGVPSMGDCKVEVQGTSYRMQGFGLDVYCDGKTVWMLDPTAKEAIAEPVNDDSFSYMSNPALLFRDMDKVFTVASATASGSGMKYNLSASKSCGIDKALLEIDRNSQLKTAEFTLDDGSVMKINVLSMKVQPLKTKESFAPGNLSSDWIITDLR